MKTMQEQVEKLIKGLQTPNYEGPDTPLEIMSQFYHTTRTRPKMSEFEFAKERVQLDRKYGRDTSWYKGTLEKKQRIYGVDSLTVEEKAFMLKGVS
jgi:hypothetical protein